MGVEKWSDIKNATPQLKGANDALKANTVDYCYDILIRILLLRYLAENVIGST